jgi:dTMP kinase
MFITLEGPEGSGKSTHATRLKSYLEGKGHKVVLTHEPGGTQIGKHIREMLLHPEATLDQHTEVMLFAADRAEHVSKIIQPALKKGKVVISDRFSDSTIAYQCGGRGLPEDLVRYVNMVSSKGLIPDLTLLLDVTPETGIRRATQNGTKDRFEKEKIDFHKKVRRRYLQIAKEDPGRVKVIKTEEKDIEKIQNEIRKVIDEKFGN